MATRSTTRSSSDAPAEGNGFGSRVQTSTAWVFAAYITHQIVRLAANLVLTRILAPDAFALMALVMIVLMGVEMLSDVGIRATTLRHRDAETPEWYQTAWTLQIIRGIVLAIIVAGLAFPVASFYEQPELAWLLLAVASVPVITGLQHTAVFLAERRLDLFKVFLTFVSEPLVAAPIGVYVAVVYETVWALAAMVIAGALIKLIMSLILFREYPLRLRLERSAALEMIHYGKWILLSTAITWLLFQIDRMSLGKLVELKTLGIYSIALMWAEVPLLAIRKWNGSVFNPVVADWYRNAPNAGELSANYRHQVAVAIAIPFGIGLGLIGAIMEFLYEPPFTESAQFLVILLLGAWIGVMEEMSARMLEVWGQPRKRMWACVVACIAFAITMFPLFSAFGAMGIAGARLVAMVALLVACWWALKPHAAVSLVGDFTATLPMLASAGVTWFVYETLRKVAGPTPTLMICLAIGAVVSLLVLRHYRDRIFLKN